MIIERTHRPPELAGCWDGPVWGQVEAWPIAHFHPRSTPHRPVTELKLLFDRAHLYALFRVADRFVRCVHTEYESDTYKDSCVELFLQPAGRTAYFALEINCGGTFSLRYIEDPTRTANRFARWAPVAPELAARLRVAHLLPEVVDPERVDPTAWWVEVAWPLSVMEAYCGPIGDPAGQQWRGNAFKCADETSHPHWASWAPIGEALNFHRPACFGAIAFASDRDGAGGIRA